VLKAPDWIQVTAPLIDFFDQRRIFFGGFNQPRLKVGDRLRVDPGCRIEPYSNVLTDFVMPRAIGAFSYSYARLHWELSIGRYCSIAPGVQVMGSAHPTEWATTSPFTNNPAPVSGIRAYLTDVGVKSFAVRFFDQGRQRIKVGHDVWIGGDAVLKRGISIGTGAVVAARSVVTKDVPPYAIVGGTPARIIRYRFPDALIERMAASRWWDYGPDLLQLLDPRSPEKFLDGIDRVRAAGHGPVDLVAISGREIIDAAVSADSRVPGAAHTMSRSEPAA
jgi:virginiamycin A acetyltransferase